MPAPDESILEDPVLKTLYDCILELMWSGFNNSTGDPENALHDVALRWTECFKGFKEGSIGIELNCIRDYIGTVEGVCQPTPNYTETNFLQQATDLTNATIILDSLVLDNSLDIQINADDIQNIYNLLDAQTPIDESLVTDGATTEFVLSQPGQNIFPGQGHKIEIWHNGGWMRQLPSTDQPTGRNFIVLDTGLGEGFNTVQMGFAPKSSSELVARYYPIPT